VVVSCLTCLDEGNDDFATLDEPAEKSQVAIGVMFIEKVLLPLEEISI
jgi:hypothetical protein